MSRERLAFIDWLKAIGITLVVYGHVAGWTINEYFPPIFPKQLGVALFVFVAGYSLASERRPVGTVVVRRLFEIVFVGALFAVLLSLIGLAVDGGARLSNFTPLAFGANVLVNNFPANPTTWYIGTYIHLIVAWALLFRHVTVTTPVLLGTLAVEIAVRAYAWEHLGGFQAYMLLPNWLGCFLLGRAAGQAAIGGRETPVKGGALGWTLVVAGLVWLIAQPALGIPLDMFGPFRPVTGGTSAGMRVVLSAAVSTLYLGTCWGLYHLTRRLGPSRAAEFLSAQTVFVFVAHMPVMYALDPLMADWSMAAQSAVRILVCYGLMAVASMYFRRLVPVTALRDRVLTWMGAAAA
ncbi:MAG: acyltransferase [Vicinamibacterales bacterium]